MPSTYELQSQLKKLPIPDLRETCENYLKVLKPLQTEMEHLKTVEAVTKFLSDGQGYYLDQELRKYAQNRNSYIEQFWYDAYLTYDSPVVLNLNPFFLLEDDPFHNESMSVNPQIKRASLLVMSSLKFIQALKNETLAPDMQRNGTPLCMFQYQKLFGASRIPTDDGCIMQSDPNSNHIVVLSKSQFYWFDVLDSQNEIILTEPELMVNLTSIILDSLKTPHHQVAKSSFGVLTTENRRIWSKIRNSSTIQNNANNSEVLLLIDSSLFVLCLDDIKLTNLSDLAKNMLCGLSILDKGIQVGTCTNRWYDKLQIIVTQNGKAGINFEHTGVDGHTVLRFVSDIYTDSILSFAQLINSNAPSLWKKANEGSNNGSRSGSNSSYIDENLVTIPRKLEWDLTPDLSLALRFGETRLSDLINQNEFRHLEFKNYGSSTIKKMKFSPDAFVQMAFQASYYALYGKVECTYEPAMTKQFFHGRTEAIRTVSQDSNLFVRKFFDASVPNKDKLAYLDNACKAHTEQTKRSLQGKGVDRHLYALFCIWKRYVDQTLEGEDHVAPQPHPTHKLDSKDGSDDDEHEEEEEHVVQSFHGLDLHTGPNGASQKKTTEEDSKTSSSEVTIGNDATTTKTQDDNSNQSFITLPEIFADGGWDKLNTTIISTSNCGNPSLRLFGFGPVSANGFGIGYIIKDDLILICVSSKHRQTQRFLTTLESYMNEIYRIWKDVNASPKTQSTTVAPIDIQTSIAQPIPKSDLSTLLGGYGYFDMGENDIKSRGPSPEPPFLHKSQSGFSLREIGKKLRLSEY
ncbi:uncharacterized protein KQ657_002127 [Scheffersomyces spartinae]|uniref:Choline/carnitine acyltransferase domain-containing protein n=1 Tax=Scheffersomyces spartinae TaxID=45513 RepID=A0A9P7VDB4_9ASCO|nr:uncharacterized protein KQ657_002127 [Scheffersomyces spartinae]KAG7195744.1 hypothetical protein KQ657_002127 [Scheffersomyces spartinae]